MDGDRVLNYQQLEVWQLGIDLVLDVYRLTGTFPSAEQFGLTNQARRSAVSVPANIAEGHGRDSTREYLRHVSIAFGSLAELETHLVIARKLMYLSAPDHAAFMETADKLGRKLRNLQIALKHKLDQ